MTYTTRHKVCDLLAAYRTEKQLSYNDLALQIGNISYAQVSNICGGKIELISDKVFNRVAAFLKLDTWRLVGTDNMAWINELLEDAQNNSRFMAITGHSGYGKTAGLTKYAGIHKNCFYMLADILIGGKKQFLRAVQKAMGINGGHSSDEILNTITERLNSLDNALLIIDDAGKLNDTCLRLIQLIYDRTERQCGLIIAGTPYLHLMLQKGITRNAMGFDELYRRIEYWLPLAEPSEEEIQAICAANGIEGNKEVIQGIANQAKNFGAVRALTTHAIRLKDKGRLNYAEFTKMVESTKAA